MNLKFKESFSSVQHEFRSHQNHVKTFDCKKATTNEAIWINSRAFCEGPPRKNKRNQNWLHFAGISFFFVSLVLLEAGFFFIIRQFCPRSTTQIDTPTQRHSWPVAFFVVVWFGLNDMKWSTPGNQKRCVIEFLMSWFIVLFTNAEGKQILVRWKILSETCGKPLDQSDKKLAGKALLWEKGKLFFSDGVERDID